MNYRMSNYKYLLILIGFMSGFGSASPTQLVDGNKFDSNAIPIFSSRFFNIDCPKMHFSEGKNFIELNNDLLEEILLNKGIVVDQQQMIVDQAAEANETAKYFFDKFKQFPDRGRYLDQAKAHSEYEKYTRNISLPLHPYLVRANVYSLGTGKFRLFLNGDSLSVKHNSLIKKAKKLEGVCLVVFIERDISSVVLSASSAQ